MAKRPMPCTGQGGVSCITCMWVAFDMTGGASVVAAGVDGTSSREQRQFSVLRWWCWCEVAPVASVHLGWVINTQAACDPDPMLYIHPPPYPCRPPPNPLPPINPSHPTQGSSVHEGNSKPVICLQPMRPSPPPKISIPDSNSPQRRRPLAPRWPPPRLRPRCRFPPAGSKSPCYAFPLHPSRMKGRRGPLCVCPGGAASVSARVSARRVASTAPRDASGDTCLLLDTSHLNLGREVSGGELLPKHTQARALRH